MALFKSKALPVVTKDIVTSIHRASCNSATAIALLHTFVRVDPPGFELDSFLSHISRDVFRVREECYLATDLEKLTETLGPIDPSDTGYWPVYTYLFALLPVLVERPRIRNTRWTAEEYQRLEDACCACWYNAHDDADSSEFMCGYNRVRTAAKSWFGRKDRITRAIELCLQKAVDEIEASFSRQNGPVSSIAFRYATEEFVDALYSAFWADLASYWSCAGPLGFFASDTAALWFDQE